MEGVRMQDPAGLAAPGRGGRGEQEGEVKDGT